MAFKRRQPIPDWRRRQIAQQEVKKEIEHQEKTGNLLGFTGWTDEEIEQLKACICPRSNCPVHPDYVAPETDATKIDKMVKRDAARRAKRS